VQLGWRGISRLFFTSFLLEQMAQAQMTAFSPLLLLDLGLSREAVAGWTGLLYTVMMVVALPMTPFWGPLAERYSRKLVIVRSYYIEAVAYTLCFFAPDVAWIIVARVLLGLTFGNVATMLATQTMLTPRNRLGSSVAMVQSAQPIAASAGPALGAFLLQFVPLRELFLLNAALSLAAGLLITFLMPEPARGPSRGRVLTRAWQIIGNVWGDPPLRWNMVGAFAVRGAQTVVDNYLPVKVIEIEPVNPAAAIGLMQGVYGALTAVATWATGRLVDRVDPARLFFRAMLFAVLVVAGMALAPNVWLLGILACLRCFPVAMSNTVLFAHLARVLPREEQTAVMNLQPLPRTVGGLVMPLVASLAIPLWAGGGLAVGAAGYLMAALGGKMMDRVTPREKPPST
jgi:DHA1 family multidrug resistance protein-like MFS transporter